jgi:hypothetical protein
MQHNRAIGIGPSEGEGVSRMAGVNVVVAYILVMTLAASENWQSIRLGRLVSCSGRGTSEHVPPASLGTRE